MEKKDKKAMKGNCTKKPYKGPHREDVKNSRPYEDKGEKKSLMVNGVEVGHFNDPEWYYPNDIIGKQVGSIPYNRPVGLKMGAVGSSAPGSVVDTPITGAGLGYVPGYGSFANTSDAVNVAARAMFSFVRKANSGSANYESSDLMTYVMAMDQVYLMMHEMRRALMTARLYQFNNRTLPSRLSTILGCNLEAVQSEFAKYSAKFNILVQKINRNLAIPKTVKLFKRRAYLAGNLFVDATSVRSQIYAFVASGYYRWTAKQAGGSSLEWTPHMGTTAVNIDVGFASRLDEVDQYVTLLISDQDIGIMCGDIIKAYGVENCYQLPYFNDEVLELVHDENVLQQIENSVIGIDATMLSGTVGALKPSDITQVNNTLQCINTLTGPNNPQDINRALEAYQRYIVNSYKDDPDWKDNLEFTRLTAAIDVEYAGSGNAKFTINYGTEWIVDMWIVCADTGSRAISHIAELKSNYDCLLPNSSRADTINDAISRYCILAWYNQLDWRPIRKLFALVGSTSDSVYEFIGCDGDLKITTTIDINTLQALHDCALLSLLDLSMISVTA